MAHISKSARTARASSRQKGAVARFWHSLRRDLFDSYRPERHYMRGPGPKWHAKQEYGLSHQGR